MGDVVPLRRSRASTGHPRDAPHHRRLRSKQRPASHCRSECPCTAAAHSIEWPQLLDVAPAGLVRGCVEPNTGTLALFRWGFGPPSCKLGQLAYDWAILVIGEEEHEIRACVIPASGRARVVDPVQPCNP